MLLVGFAHKTPEKYGDLQEWAPLSNVWADCQQCVEDADCDETVNYVLLYAQNDGDGDTSLYEAVATLAGKGVEELFPRSIVVAAPVTKAVSKAAVAPEVRKCQRDHNVYDCWNYKEEIYACYFEQGKRYDGTKCRKCKHLLTGAKKPTSTLPVYGCQSLLLFDQCHHGHDGIVCNACFKSELANSNGRRGKHPRRGQAPGP